MVKNFVLMWSFTLDIKKEVAELSKREHQLKSEGIEVKEKLKNYNDAINDLKAQIHQWKAKVAAEHCFERDSLRNYVYLF